MIHLTGLSISTTLSLEKTGLFLTISFGEVNLSLGDIILYLGELGPPPGKTCMIRGTCPFPTSSLKEVTFSIALSFGGVNLPLEEKSLFLEEHSLNLPASFFLGAMNLSCGGVGLFVAFSLEGTNSSSREFVLPFGENFLSLENWLYCHVPCYIPFIKFLLDGGSIQTIAHSFFNLSIRTIQYLGTHTFLGESFPAFFDSINVIRSKIVVLIEATSGKGSLSIAIASFL